MSSLPPARGKAESAVVYLHDLLSSTCEDFPDHVAIESASGRITYKELARRVRPRQAAVAELLPQGGVVAVVGHRSVEVVLSSRAIWLAGSTVLLIDDALPADRQALMMAMVPPAARFDCNGDEAVLRSTEVLAGGSVRVPPGDVPPQADRAYVAFTSGSTGRPKAILGSHAGLAHFLQWQRSEFGIGPDDRFAHLTNLSFDVWFRDAFTPLISGATLCIPRARYLGAAELFDFMEQAAITAMHVVPSVANHWVQNAPARAPYRAMRLAFFAGEPLEGVLVRRWTDRFPNCQVVNLYGPTETTLAKHFRRVPSLATDGIQAVGQPLPETSTFILDDALALCPDGTQGEICISTPHRSLGYLVDQSLVSPFVRFEPPGITSCWVYRTGDLGLRNADGEIEVHGRKDDQVKIQGVRIDLLEIKSMIASWPGVRDVFVCAVTERHGKAIVALVEGREPLSRDLSGFLRRKLPAGMVPSRIHIEAALPRLPNGKMDRARLQAMAAGHAARRLPAPEQKGAATVEDRVARLWELLLGEAPVSRTCNFFESGGTSLTIVELHARIEQTFAVKLPLVRLFEHSSVIAQAALIGQVLKGGCQTTDPGPPTAAEARASLRARAIQSRRGTLKRLVPRVPLTNLRT